MEEYRAALAVIQNDAQRWEWMLSFTDEVHLPSKRVSDVDYATREEAEAAGEAVREQFAARTA